MKAISSAPVTDFIPQRAPIVMIDALCESDAVHTLTSFTIRSGGLFVADGVLKEPGLIENIAQTAAAGSGYQFHLKKEPVPIGFIGAIKNLVIQSLPPVDSVIQTRVTILEEIFGVTLIKGNVFLKDTLIASCEMKIVLKTGSL